MCSWTLPCASSLVPSVLQLSHWLPVLSNIEPPALRRKLVEKIVNDSWPIQPDILRPPLLRLTYRKPLWLDLQPVYIKRRWRHNCTPCRNPVKPVPEKSNVECEWRVCVSSTDALVTRHSLVTAKGEVFVLLYVCLFVRSTISQQPVGRFTPYFACGRSLGRDVSSPLLGVSDPRGGQKEGKWHGGGLIRA